MALYSREKYVQEVTDVADKVDSLALHPREISIIQQAITQTKNHGKYKQTDPTLQLLDFQNYFRPLVDQLRDVQWKTTFLFECLIRLLYPDMTDAIQTKLCDIQSLLTYAQSKARFQENPTRVYFSGATLYLNIPS